MEGWNNTLLALERTVKPLTGYPIEPEAGETGRRLNISVVFTSVDTTITALRKAGTLASRLGAQITLLVPQMVPYPLPLASPPVLIDWSEKRFRVIAAECPVETTVRIYLCRDCIETLAMVLSPGSIVVIGSRKRWWPTAEKRMAHRLRRSGHEVILTELE